ncbi:hypothetical protein [Azospirillum doebereinerae]
MKAAVLDLQQKDAAFSSKMLVGRFVRRQGQYGLVEVIARVTEEGLIAVEAADRIYTPRGQVETYGTHAALKQGEWVEFDVVKNPRPRAPAYRLAHLRRLPRYAVLPDATVAEYRNLLTKEGWREDHHPGLWALRVSGDKVLVVELARDVDGALRMPKNATGKVKWLEFDDGCVKKLPAGSGSDDLYLADGSAKGGSFDWSDEADHVAHVIRSLSDANDPRVSDIITWLDLHHEAGTGRVFAATVDHEAAAAALRSGELAEKLRADRELMKSYLDAAVENPAVKEAIAEYAREGENAERAKLRTEFEQKLAAERDRRISELTEELAANRKDAMAKVENDINEHTRRLAAERDDQERGERAALEAKLEALRAESEAQRSSLEDDIRSLKSDKRVADDAKREAETALKGVRVELECVRSELQRTVAEVDRLLLVASQLELAQRTEARGPATPANMPFTSFVVPERAFPEHPLVSVKTKGDLIKQHALLKEQGKALLRKLVVLMLAGELPILTGKGASDLLLIAEAVLSPGRSAIMEADPTLISIEDVWARPGSGAPTAIAVAARAAAERKGSVFAVIRGVERSGARFWMPALANGLRSGALPRELLICCTVHDRDHEEVAALAKDFNWLEVGDVFAEGAYLAAPMVLTLSKREDLSALDPGSFPSDLTAGSSLLHDFGFKLSLAQAMRVARIYKEAQLLTEEDAVARQIAEDVARAMNETKD